MNSVIRISLLSLLWMSFILAVVNTVSWNSVEILFCFSLRFSYFLQGNAGMGP
jgi:hypothetical protein